MAVGKIVGQRKQPKPKPWVGEVEISTVRQKKPQRAVATKAVIGQKEQCEWYE